MKHFTRLAAALALVSAVALPAFAAGAPHLLLQVKGGTVDIEQAHQSGLL
jgi:hypothetical protein